MNLSIGEMLVIMAHRKKIKLKDIAEKVGYKRTTLYAKIKKNRWSINDVRRLKAEYKQDFPVEELIGRWPL